jgi:hypothetical protein
MIRRILTALFLIGGCLVQSVSADEGEKTLTGPQIAGMALMLEGVIGINAYLASLNPKVYGVAGALLFPLAGGSSKSSETARWVGLAAVEALALYNISIDEDKMSKSEIFRANIIGWHAAAGIMAVTGYFAGDFNKDKKMSLNYMPETHGGRLILSYRF